METESKDIQPATQNESVPYIMCGHLVWAAHATLHI